MADANSTPYGRPDIAQLGNLPQEVYDLIFKHVHSKQSLWSLLLQSRRMYHAVLPWLYKSVYFEVDSTVDLCQANYKLLQMVDKENLGLQHLRYVRLTPQDELERHPRDVAGYPDAVLFMAAIPKDTLTSFFWDSCHQIPDEVLRLLWTRQRKLSSIQLLDCGKGVERLLKEMGSYGEHFYEHATSLRVTDFRSGSVPETAVRLLRDRPEIQRLTVEFQSIKMRLEDLDDQHEWREYDHVCDSYYKGLLLKGLFAPPQSLKPAKLLTLKSLSLYAVALYYNSKLLLDALDTTVLKTLSIISCEGYWRLLTPISKLPTDTRPQLRGLYVYCEEDRSGGRPLSTEAVTSIDDLLLSTNDTLRELWIVMRWMDIESTPLGMLSPGITNHGDSLLRLTADIRQGPPPYRGEQVVAWFPRRPWERMCARFSRLEELYVAFPPVVANETLDSRREFQDYMTAALQIPSLKTLNMNTWPYPMGTQLFKPGDPQPYRYPPAYIHSAYSFPSRSPTLTPKFYNHCLLFLVDYIVDLRAKLVSHPNRPLEIVGIGVVEGGHFMLGLEDQLKNIFFARSPGSGLSGDSQAIMRQRTMRQLDHDGLMPLLRGLASIDLIAKRDRFVRAS